MKRLNYFICAAFAVAATVACDPAEDQPKDFPVVGEIALSGESTNAATNSWYPGEKLGVFVTSDGLTQSNLLYTPSETCADNSVLLDENDPTSKYWMFGDPVGNVALTASAEKAGFKQGVHNVYAYSPYNAAATDVTAVPMPDLTKQDELTFRGQTTNPALSFVYASKVVEEYTSAPVDLGTFTCVTMALNTGSIEFSGQESELVGKKLVKMVVTADKPIAYSNAKFNLVEKSISGTSAPVEVTTNQEIKASEGLDFVTMQSVTIYSTGDPVKFVIIAPASLDELQSMKFNFTAVLDDNSEWTVSEVSPNVMNIGGSTLITFGGKVVGLTKK